MESEIQPRLEHSPASRTLRILLWILIVLAAAEFVVRGPVRYLSWPTNWNDFSQNYTVSKLWLKGLSPSDPNNFVVLWAQEGHSRLDLDDIRTHLAPPLGGLVVMAPVAALPWQAAKITWLVILLLSFAATVWALASTANLSGLRALAFVAACLALAPFHTGLASGNTSVLVIGLCAVAIWAARSGNDAVAGVLFGMACSVKPQLGAFLVLYYLVRRRWRLFATAVGTTIGLNLVAVLHLQLRGASWVNGYLQNARGFVTANHIDDFTTANPSRFMLINLQVPFFSITGQASRANLLAFAVVVILVCVWIYSVVKSGKHTPELLSLSAISVIALLPVYHRFYDAALLAVPLCWCLITMAMSSKTIAKITLLLMTPFLIPGTALLQQLALHGTISEQTAQSWWWNCIVMPHETWVLLLLSMILIWEIRRKGINHEGH